MPEITTDSSIAPAVRTPLYKRFQSSAGKWATLRGWWPWLTLAALLMALGWMFVKPAPPSHIVIAAGPNDGAYKWFAEHYAKTFAENGVKLEVQETFGSVDNYRLLDAEAARGPSWRNDGVSVAMVQSGTCPEGIKAGLRAVASLYLEPVWIFYRTDAKWQLNDLRGRRVCVGPEGSGSRSIMQRLLSANSISWESGALASSTFTRPATASAPSDDAVQFLPQSGRAAADLLRDGRIDAAVFVFSPRHPLVAELLQDANLHIMSFDRHEAYARVFPFLSDVKLPRGAVDLTRDLPREDIHLLAPAANLICRDGLHPAIVALLIKAAIVAHERGDLLSPPGKLPSTEFVEFPIDPAAAEYFRSGQPFLQRYLPFWAAALVDRMKILLLPLITLLIPLARLAPPLYVWRIRSRIYRWYGVLREIDRKLRDDAAASEKGPRRFDTDLATIQQMEKELGEETMPLSYMEEYYNLRLHTDFLKRRLVARVEGKAE